MDKDATYDRVKEYIGLWAKQYDSQLKSNGPVTGEDPEYQWHRRLEYEYSKRIGIIQENEKSASDKSDSDREEEVQSESESDDSEEPNNVVSNLITIKPPRPALTSELDSQEDHLVFNFESNERPKEPPQNIWGSGASSELVKKLKKKKNVKSKKSGLKKSGEIFDTKSATKFLDSSIENSDNDEEGDVSSANSSLSFIASQQLPLLKKKQKSNSNKQQKSSDKFKDMNSATEETGKEVKETRKDVIEEDMEVDTMPPSDSESNLTKSITSPGHKEDENQNKVVGSDKASTIQQQQEEDEQTMDKDHNSDFVKSKRKSTSPPKRIIRKIRIPTINAAKPVKPRVVESPVVSSRSPIRTPAFGRRSGREQSKRSDKNILSERTSRHRSRSISPSRPIFNTARKAKAIRPDRSRHGNDEAQNIRRHKENSVEFSTPSFSHYGPRPTNTEKATPMKSVLSSTKKHIPGSTARYRHALIPESESKTNLISEESIEKEKRSETRNIEHNLHKKIQQESRSDGSNKRIVDNNRERVYHRSRGDRSNRDSSQRRDDTNDTEAQESITTAPNAPPPLSTRGTGNNRSTRESRDFRDSSSQRRHNSEAQDDRRTQDSTVIAPNALPASSARSTHGSREGYNPRDSRESRESRDSRERSRHRSRHRSKRRSDEDGSERTHHHSRRRRDSRRSSRSRPSSRSPSPLTVAAVEATRHGLNVSSQKGQKVTRGFGYVSNAPAESVPLEQQQQQQQRSQQLQQRPEQREQHEQHSRRESRSGCEQSADQFHYQRRRQSEQRPYDNERRQSNRGFSDAPQIDSSPMPSTGKQRQEWDVRPGDFRRDNLNRQQEQEQYQPAEHASQDRTQTKPSTRVRRRFTTSTTDGPTVDVIEQASLEAPAGFNEFAENARKDKLKFSLKKTKGSSVVRAVKHLNVMATQAYPTDESMIQQPQPPLPQQPQQPPQLTEQQQQQHPEQPPIDTSLTNEYPNNYDPSFMYQQQQVTQASDIITQDTHDFSHGFPPAPIIAEDYLLPPGMQKGFDALTLDAVIKNLGIIPDEKIPTSEEQVESIMVPPMELAHAGDPSFQDYMSCVEIPITAAQPESDVDMDVDVDEDSSAEPPIADNVVCETIAIESEIPTTEDNENMSIDTSIVMKDSILPSEIVVEDEYNEDEMSEEEPEEHLVISPPKTDKTTDTSFTSPTRKISVYDENFLGPIVVNSPVSETDSTNLSRSISLVNTAPVQRKRFSLERSFSLGFDGLKTPLAKATSGPLSAVPARIDSSEDEEDEDDFMKDYYKEVPLTPAPNSKVNRTFDEYKYRMESPFCSVRKTAHCFRGNTPRTSLQRSRSLKYLSSGYSFPKHLHTGIDTFGLSFGRVTPEGMIESPILPHPSPIKSIVPFPSFDKDSDSDESDQNDDFIEGDSSGRRESSSAEDTIESEELDELPTDEPTPPTQSESNQQSDAEIQPLQESVSETKSDSEFSEESMDVCDSTGLESELPIEEEGVTEVDGDIQQQQEQEQQSEVAIDNEQQQQQQQEEEEEEEQSQQEQEQETIVENPPAVHKPITGIEVNEDESDMIVENTIENTVEESLGMDNNENNIFIHSPHYDIDNEYYDEEIDGVEESKETDYLMFGPGKVDNVNPYSLLPPPVRSPPVLTGFASANNASAKVVSDDTQMSDDNSDKGESDNDEVTGSVSEEMVEEEEEEEEEELMDNDDHVQSFYRLQPPTNVIVDEDDDEDALFHPVIGESGDDDDNSNVMESDNEYEVEKTSPQTKSIEEEEERIEFTSEEHNEPEPISEDIERVETLNEEEEISIPTTDEAMNESNELPEESEPVNNEQSEVMNSSEEFTEQMMETTTVTVAEAKTATITETEAEKPINIDDEEPDNGDIESDNSTNDLLDEIVAAAEMDEHDEELEAIDDVTLPEEFDEEGIEKRNEIDSENDMSHESPSEETETGTEIQADEQTQISTEPCVEEEATELDDETITMEQQQQQQQQQQTDVQVQVVEKSQSDETIIEQQEEEEEEEKESHDNVQITEKLVSKPVCIDQLDADVDLHDEVEDIIEDEEEVDFSSQSEAENEVNHEFEEIIDDEDDESEASKSEREEESEDEKSDNNEKDISESESDIQLTDEDGEIEIEEVNLSTSTRQSPLPKKRSHEPASYSRSKQHSSSSRRMSLGEDIGGRYRSRSRSRGRSRISYDKHISSHQDDEQRIRSKSRRRSRSRRHVSKSSIRTTHDRSLSPAGGSYTKSIPSTEVKSYYRGKIDERLLRTRDVEKEQRSTSYQQQPQPISYANNRSLDRDHLRNDEHVRDSHNTPYRHGNRDRDRDRVHQQYHGPPQLSIYGPSSSSSSMNVSTSRRRSPLRVDYSKRDGGEINDRDNREIREVRETPTRRSHHPRLRRHHSGSSSRPLSPADIPQRSADRIPSPERFDRDLSRSHSKPQSGSSKHSETPRPVENEPRSERREQRSSRDSITSASLSSLSSNQQQLLSSSSSRPSKPSSSTRKRRSLASPLREATIDKPHAQLASQDPRMQSPTQTTQTHRPPPTPPPMNSPYNTKKRSRSRRKLDNQSDIDSVKDLPISFPKAPNTTKKRTTEESVNSNSRKRTLSQDHSSSSIERLPTSSPPSKRSKHSHSKHSRPTSIRKADKAENISSDRRIPSSHSRDQEQKQKQLRENRSRSPIIHSRSSSSISGSITNRRRSRSLSPATTHQQHRQQSPLQPPRKSGSYDDRNDRSNIQSIDRRRRSREGEHREFEFAHPPIRSSNDQQQQNSERSQRGSDRRNSQLEKPKEQREQQQQQQQQMQQKQQQQMQQKQRTSTPSRGERSRREEEKEPPSKRFKRASGSPDDRQPHSHRRPQQEGQQQQQYDKPKDMKERRREVPQKKKTSGFTDAPVSGRWNSIAPPPGLASGYGPKRTRPASEVVPTGNDRPVGGRRPVSSLRQPQPRRSLDNTQGGHYGPSSSSQPSQQPQRIPSLQQSQMQRKPQKTGMVAPRIRGRDTAAFRREPQQQQQQQQQERSSTRSQKDILERKSRRKSLNQQKQKQQEVDSISITRSDANNSQQQRASKQQHQQHQPQQQDSERSQRDSDRRNPQLEKPKQRREQQQQQQQQDSRGSDRRNVQLQKPKQQQQQQQQQQDSRGSDRRNVQLQKPKQQREQQKMQREKRSSISESDSIQQFSQSRGSKIQRPAKVDKSTTSHKEKVRHFQQQKEQQQQKRQRQNSDQRVSSSKRPTMTKQNSNTNLNKNNRRSSGIDNKKRRSNNPTSDRAPLAKRPSTQQPQSLFRYAGR